MQLRKVVVPRSREKLKTRHRAVASIAIEHYPPLLTPPPATPMENPGALLLLLSVHSLRAQGFCQYSTKSDALYGPATPEAQQRIHAWQQLLLQLRNADEQTQLRAVNQFFNDKIRYTEDIDVWHNVDYWATLSSRAAKVRRDCEDYAIAKYFTLRQLGVSEDKLRITYVKALRLNRAHMVLTWYATLGRFLWCSTA